MISVAVKVQTECGTCRMPMPVNTLAREVSCPSCGRPTAIGADIWQALLRDPLYDGPRMIQKETRQTSSGKLSATYTRLGFCCQGCEKEISAASIREVREQATLRCDRCAQQTWVRTVPAELSGALPNITHLIGEDPDPLAGAPADGAEAATFPCPQCGSPLAFDGVNRACTCRFCRASVHVPDEFVFRGRRKVAASWFLCFHESVTEEAPAAQAVAAGLFDWNDPPDAAVDSDGNLYCAATQSHWVPGEGVSAKEEHDNVIWSIDSSMNVRWLRRDQPTAARLVLSPNGTLLVSSQRKLSRPWLSSMTGTPVEGAAGKIQEIDGQLLDCEDLACASDGSLVMLKDGLLRRITPSGEELPLWAGGTVRSARPIEHLGWLKQIHCGADGSIYCMYGAELVRVDPDGHIVYRIELISGESAARRRVLGADVGGNAYVLRGEQLVRVDEAGEQSVILESRRDGLPMVDMSIAVCPDGSYWLFGKKGRAWKFEASGTLLFASGRESRPRKPTYKEVFERQLSAVQAKREAEQEEQLRLEKERIAMDDRRKRPLWIALEVGFVVFLVLLMVAVFR